MAGSAEETLGLLKGVGIDAAGQNFAGVRHFGVVGAGQTRDGVEQDDHILAKFHISLGLLDHHLGDLHVALRRLVEGG